MVSAGDSIDLFYLSPRAITWIYRQLILEPTIPNIKISKNTAMQKIFRKQAIIAAAIALSFSIAGCGPNRIEQCNQLIATINKGSALVNDRKDTHDAASHRNLAGELKAVASQIESLQLEDETLQQYQSRFMGFFRELSQAFTEMAKALQAADGIETNLEGRKRLEDAQTQLALAGKKANKTAELEDSLIVEVQNYCKSK